MSGDVRSRADAEAAKRKKKKKTTPKPKPKPLAPSVQQKAAAIKQRNLAQQEKPYRPVTVKPQTKKNTDFSIKLMSDDVVTTVQGAQGTQDSTRQWGGKTTEERVGNLIDSYFRDNHSMPDPTITAQLMMSYKFPETEEQYAALWAPHLDANEKESPFLLAGDFMQIDDPENGIDTVANMLGINDFERKVGGKGFKTGANREEQGIKQRPGETRQTTLKTINEQMDYIRRFSAKRFPSVQDFVGATNSYQVARLAIWEREKQRGLKPKWKPMSTEYDIGFDTAVRKYIFARQLAFAMFGTAEERSKANRIIEKVRLGFGGDVLDKQAKRLGIEQGTFGPMDTVDGIIDVFRSADSDTMNRLAYRSWMFGRPIGESEAAARKAYVVAFGMERLPTQAIKDYKDENKGLMDLLAQGSDAVKDGLALYENVPVVGSALASVGHVVNNANEILMEPINWTMQGISTAGGVLEIATTGMSFTEYSKKMEEYGGEEAYQKAEGTHGFDWAALVDLGNWSNSWSEMEGKTPVALAMDNYMMRWKGHTSSSAAEVAQLADFGVMIYVGAKVGDPIVFGGVKLGLKGAWRGARVIDKGIYSYKQSRPGFFTNGQAGMLDLGGNVKPPKWRIGMESDMQSPLFMQAADSLIRRIVPLKKVRELHETATGKTLEELQDVRGKQIDELSNQNLDRRFRDDKPVDPMAAVFVWDKDRGVGWLGRDFQDGIHRMTRAEVAGLDEGPVAFILRDTMNHNIKVKDFPDAVKALDDLTGGREWKHGDAIEAKPQTAIGQTIVSTEKSNGLTTIRLKDGTKVESPKDVSGQIAHINEAGYKTSVVSRVDDITEIEIADLDKMSIVDRTHLVESARDAGVILRKTDGGIVVSGNTMKISRLSRNLHGKKPAEPKFVHKTVAERQAYMASKDFSYDKPAYRMIEDAMADMDARSIPEALGGHDTLGWWHNGDPDIRIGVAPAGDDTVHLSTLMVKEDAAAGSGSMALEEICSRADRAGVTLTLEAVPLDMRGLRKAWNQTDLEAWYRAKGGFISDGNGKMHRPPKKPITGQEGNVTVDFLTGGLLSKWIGKPGAPGSTFSVQPYCPPTILATNAELLAKIFSESTIARLYGVPEDVQAAKDIVVRIAKSKDPDEIATALRELEEHAVDIDGGAAAGIRAVRYGLQQKGIGTLGWSRVFSTMTTYGKMQPIDHASDNLWNVGRAIKLGDKAGKRETLDRLTDLVDRMYKAPNGEKQSIADEMWAIFEKNLGTEGLKAYKDYERSIWHARGKAYMDKVHRHAYLGVKKDGEVAEGSVVIPPGIAKTLDTDVQATLRKFEESHLNEEKAIQSKIDTLETMMKSKTGGTAGKQGVKGSAELTRLRKQLADAKRLRERAIDPDLAKSRIAIAQLAKKYGANEQELSNLADAVRFATQRAQRQADAHETLARLGGLKKMSDKQRKEFNEAKDALSEFGSAQPFKMGQLRTHINHKYDPRIAGWYMSGGSVQKFMVADQAVFEPLMRVFKETVMASLAFPLRVNVGDELVRLIPEGVVGRMRGTRKAMKQLKLDGTDFSPFESALRDSLAGDWMTGGRIDDWTMLTKFDDGYYEHLKNDLISWRNEPIVQWLIADRRGGKGNFPESLKDISAFIKRIRDERVTVKREVNGVMTDVQELSPRAQELRNFLNETLRSDEAWKTINGKRTLVDVYDTDMFKEWCNGWNDRMSIIAKAPELRKAMTGDVTLDELVALGERQPDLLWPVNAPAKQTLDFSLRSGNPMYLLQKLNPYHYPYQFMTVKMLGSMGEKIKTALFNDRYIQLRTEILARHPKIDPDELHKICGERALKHANQAAYSRSTTMFEDMSRNLLPFISAYRQFWIYWGATALKHPISMSVVKEQYPEFMQDPFAFAGGDVQFLTPSIPFWGPSPEDGSSGLFSEMKGQLPQASWLMAAPAKTLMGAANMDAEQFADIPFMGSLGKNYAPFRRQGQLFYGAFGVMPWLDSMDSVFGDKEKLAKAHANAVMYWTKYGADPTGASIDMSNTPWWAKPAMWVSDSTSGWWNPKAEALYNEVLKTGSPINAYYSPDDVRERANLMAEFQTYVKNGDERGKSMLRAQNPEFDRYITYYEVDDVAKNEMRHDPENANLLKWWVSPWNYDQVGNFLTAKDWESNAFAGGRAFKTDRERVAYVHNLYTSIYGGTFVPGGSFTPGSNYPGDILRAKAEKVYKRKTEKALAWAQETAKALALKNGWNAEDLMYYFKHPGAPDPDTGERLGWGPWNKIIRDRDLNPNDYDVMQLEDDFVYNFGSDFKNNAFSASPEELQKAMGILKWVQDPKLVRKMQQETPNLDDATLSRQDIKDEILKKEAFLAGNKWYYVTAQQLRTIGIKADDKIDVIQLELKKAWEKWHESTAGSEKYRDGRNAYYALQRKMLGNVEGGDTLIGGLADRLEHINHFTSMRTITPGSGKGAVKQQEAWQDYLKVRNQELNKSNPNMDRVEKAWEKFAGEETGEKDAPWMEQRQLEKGRVRMWHTILESADKYRKILVNSDSDYYQAKGNSTESKFGQKYVSDLKQMISAAAKVNPYFAKDVDQYFSSTDSLASHLLDWYNY